jgi:hypothetical protein
MNQRPLLRPQARGAASTLLDFPRRMSSHQTDDRTQATIASRSTAPAPPLAVTRMAACFLGALVVMIAGIVAFAKLDATETNLAPGAVLAASDMRMAGQDYVVEFNKGLKYTSMLIWDFAAEDGDQVEILANGQLVNGPFILRHTPVAIQLPVGAQVEVRGVVDGGGGGVTYAVNFPELPRTILNSADPGTSNRYSLVEKP